MAWWIYLGKVTTPVDIPGKGPTVLVPRLKFEAPMSSVAHLVRLKHVVPLKPHQIPKVEPKVAPEKGVPAAPAAGPKKSEEKPVEATTDKNASVVASGPADTGEEASSEQAGAEEKTKVMQETEEKEGKKGSKRRRG